MTKKKKRELEEQQRQMQMLKQEPEYEILRKNKRINCSIWNRCF